MPLLHKTTEETVSATRTPAAQSAQVQEVQTEVSETGDESPTLLRLLRVYEREERKREKLVALYPYLTGAATFFQIMAAFPLLFVSLGQPYRPHALRDELPREDILLFASLFFGTVLGAVAQLWQMGSFTKRPNFSSAAQQAVITDLLDNGDVWLTADALARATTYYTGDRNRLYDQLARALALLPDEPGALSPLAHRALAFCRDVPKAHAEWKTDRLPHLQTAIVRYQTRNEIAGLRAKKGRHA